MADNQEIKEFIAKELVAGQSLSDIQDKVNAKFSCKKTFMEIRLLAAEIEDIDWKSLDPEPPKNSAGQESSRTRGTAAGPGRTEITLSRVLRPGAVVGGSVRFGSGARAEWFMDQFGQCGFDNVSGEPTEQDEMDFQRELQRVLSSR